MNRIKSLDPFFILYDARSGSTFLADLLIKHLNVSIPPESNFIPRILRLYPKHLIETIEDLESIIRILYNENKFNNWDIKENYIRSYFSSNFPLNIREFILLLCNSYRNNFFPKSEISGIKKGSYLNHSDQLIQLFPNTKFIGIIRDGRAVFNSKKNSIYTETGEPFETDPYKAANKWIMTIRKLRRIEKENRVRILIIYYEHLVTDPLKTVRRIKEFLELPTEVNEKSGKMFKVPSSYGDLHKNIGKKPLINRISAWRKSLSKAEIYAYESVAFKLLKAEGYRLMNSELTLRNPVKRHLSRIRSNW